MVWSEALKPSVRRADAGSKISACKVRVTRVAHGKAVSTDRLASASA